MIRNLNVEDIVIQRGLDVQEYHAVEPLYRMIVNVGSRIAIETTEKVTNIKGFQAKEDDVLKRNYHSAPSRVAAREFGQRGNSII